jgi:cytochrome oxidase Cu insertion factor (SCO1/SenC/PrrC family)
MMAFVAWLAIVSGSLSRPEPFVPPMHVGDTVPDAQLIDETGLPLSLRNAGGPTVVSFFFTRCPDPRVCSLVTAKFAQLERLLRDTHVRLVEVTLDPQYDRPRILRRYAAAAGAHAPNWRFATGRPADVFALSQRFGIVLDRARTGALAHSQALAIVSRDGVASVLLDGDDWSAQDVAAEARAQARLSSNPLRRFALSLFARVSAACGEHGLGAIPIPVALALFAALTVVFGWVVLRLFAATFAERSS